MDNNQYLSYRSSPLHRNLTPRATNTLDSPLNTILLKWMRWCSNSIWASSSSNRCTINITWIALRLIKLNKWWLKAAQCTVSKLTIKRPWQSCKHKPTLTPLAASFTSSKWSNSQELLRRKLISNSSRPSLDAWSMDPTVLLQLEWWFLLIWWACHSDLKEWCLLALSLMALVNICLKNSMSSLKSHPKINKPMLKYLSNTKALLVETESISLNIEPKNTSLKTKRARS